MKFKVNVERRNIIHISKGNKKLGKDIYTFNTLPGNDYVKLKDGDCVCNVKGTCDCNCEGCYAIKGLKAYYKSVAPANGENTLIMRENRKFGFDSISQYCKDKGVKVFRWHSSGEIMDLDYLREMCRVAKENSEVKFYFYTKRFDLIKKVKLPDNLVCNLSEWKGNLGKDEFKGMNRFVLDDGSDKNIAKLWHCPGYKGVKCSDCGVCWKNHGKRIAVYEH